MIHNLLLSGGPGHDFAAAAAVIDGLLAEVGIATTVVDDPAAAFARLDEAEQGRVPPVALMTVHALHWRMEQAHYSHLREDMAYSLRPEDAARLDRFVRRGGGLLALHTAVICFDADPRWHLLCGASWDWATSSHPPLGNVAVTVTDAGRRHAVTEAFADFEVTDEAYRDLRAAPGLVPLLTTADDDGHHPLLWAREVGNGRVVTDLLGHGVTSLQQPTHRAILAGAAAWASRRPLPSGVGSVSRHG